MVKQRKRQDERDVYRGIKSSGDLVTRPDLVGLQLQMGNPLAAQMDFSLITALTG